MLAHEAGTQKTRVAGPQTPCSGTQPYKENSAQEPRWEIGGTQVAFLLVENHCRHIRNIGRQSGSLHNVCSMCGSRSPLWGSGHYPSVTNQLVHREAAGNCMVMELGDLISRPVFQGVVHDTGRSLTVQRPGFWCERKVPEAFCSFNNAGLCSLGRISTDEGCGHSPNYHCPC